MTVIDRTRRLPATLVGDFVLGTRSTRTRVLLYAGAVAAVGLIGWLDAVTPRMSMSVFYLLPVVVGAVAVSRLAGYSLAAFASLAGVVAGNITSPGQTVPVYFWNFVIRSLTFSVVVLLLGALGDALADAAASRRRTEEFLATAAHQLRTPIAGLVASAEALAVERHENVRMRLTENLVSSADRLGRLLSSLLRLSRFENTESSERGEIDLAEVGRTEAESAHIRFPELDFVYVGPDCLPLPLSSQPITEALTNLLDNAARHAAALIEVRVMANGETATLEVIDDGPGIPAGLEERVFERFESLDGHGGSGLGLSIARRLIESQDGQLNYVDDAFRVTLPKLSIPTRS